MSEEMSQEELETKIKEYARYLYTLLVRKDPKKYTPQEANLRFALEQFHIFD